MNDLNRKRLTVLLSIVAGCVLAYFVLPRLLVLLAPFILAWIISWIAQPVSDFLTKKIHLPQRIAGIITIILILGIVGGLLFALIYQLVQEASTLIDQIPTYYQNITYYVGNFLENLQHFLPRLPDSVNAMLQELPAKLTGLIGEALAAVATPISRFALNTASSVPSVLIFIVMTFLATYFLLADKRKFKAWLRENLPEKAYTYSSAIKSELKSALGGYIRAQLILMLITFCELFIGFSILKVRYALFLAIIIAIMDAIPVLGTGTFLIPFSIINFIMGDWKLGIGLLILYGVCLLMRQILEPRILSHQIGLHPLVTLVSMYIGFKLFGIFGMILGPIVSLIIRYLYQKGIFYPLFPMKKKKDDTI